MSEVNLDTKLINLKVNNNVGIVTIDNPPVNVLNKQVFSELDQVVEHIKTNDEIKVIVVTGAGNKAFVAGADIKAMPDLKEETGTLLSLTGQVVFSKLESLDKVSIAAINGFALGGGLELAMSCDIRFCSNKAKLGLPEINLGIMPGYGGTQRLTSLVGKSKAKELILTGDNISADEALELGIVDHITDPEETLNSAVKMAEKIASKAQIAVREAKRAINLGYETNLANGLIIEAQCFGRVCDTEDKNEGVIAFIEKRKPNFKDR